MLHPAKHARYTRRGFTLIELLLVISIIAVLTAVAVFAIAGISNKSKRASCTSDVATVQDASDNYYVGHNAYAADIPTLVAANLLRSAPSSAAYTLALSTTNGAVTVTAPVGGCAAL